MLKIKLINSIAPFHAPSNEIMMLDIAKHIVFYGPRATLMLNMYFLT